MSKLLQDTAIIIFSRTAEAEASEKSLIYGDSKKKVLAEMMINRTKRVVKSCALPAFFFSEHHQVGSNFGERFTNAVEFIFDKGYNKVIVVGNDCLTLTKNDLLMSAKLLESTPSVLGPSTDGGVYLMGIQKQAFQKDDFLNIQWQTEHVFAELSALHQNIEILPSKSDIDTSFDLIVSLKTFFYKLQQAIINLLKDSSKVYHNTFLKIRSVFQYAFKSLRAPPCKPLFY